MNIVVGLGYVAQILLQDWASYFTAHSWVALCWKKLLHPMLCHLPGDNLHLLGGSKVWPLASICYNSKGPPSAPKRPLLQMRHRLTSPSAHLCLQNPLQMLLLRVLLNKLHAHKSWSLRICFLGNLDILRILCLHSKEQLLSLFPILWMSSILWWSQNSHNLVNFPIDICHAVCCVAYFSNECSLKDLK